MTPGLVLSVVRPKCRTLSRRLVPVPVPVHLPSATQWHPSGSTSPCKDPLERSENVWEAYYETDEAHQAATIVDYDARYQAFTGGFLAFAATPAAAAAERRPTAQRSPVPRVSQWERQRKEHDARMVRKYGNTSSLLLISRGAYFAARPHEKVSLSRALSNLNRQNPREGVANSRSTHLPSRTLSTKLPLDLYAHMQPSEPETATNTLPYDTGRGQCHSYRRQNRRGMFTPVKFDPPALRDVPMITITPPTGSANDECPPAKLTDRKEDGDVSSSTALDLARTSFMAALKAREPTGNKDLPHPMDISAASAIELFSKTRERLFWTQLPSPSFASHQTATGSNMKPPVRGVRQRTGVAHAVAKSASCRKHLG